MPPVPTVSPATGASVSSHFIHTANNHFLDSTGRAILLRGVNLSGSAKAPVGKPSHVVDDVASDGAQCFIGRPLNLDDGSADVHLARLKGWGFNMLRYVVTWEALEHDGPGQYDFDFLDYTIAVLRKCKEYGFKVYIDPHQDVWSRFSGGSGAPYWTLPACGIDPMGFVATKAAIVHSEYPSREKPDPASLPAMIWSTNYSRTLSQTMFTLFFAGKDFAPKCIIDGQNIQDWLQSHYIAAFGLLADRIRDEGDLLDQCVIGWDSLNEPFEGLCGNNNLNVMATETTATLKKGPAPTPAQGLRLGMGLPQTVDTWSFSPMGPRKEGQVTIDPRGVTIWLNPSEEREDGVNEKWGWRRHPAWKLGKCIWAQHGVWDIQSGEISRPEYFRHVSGRQVVFIDDYWKPHWKAFSKRIRQSHPESIMFIQPPVFAQPPTIDQDDLKGRCAYSAHYYDGLTLVSRHWNWFNADALGLLRGKYKSVLQAVKIGEWMIRKSLQEQLGVLKADAQIIGDYPTIIGEIGTPFDMDGKASYGWTDDGKHKGDYSNQEKALDASMNAADGPNALNFTLWTYCPDSSHMWGDGWNMEDLSIWSRDDLKKIDKPLRLRVPSTNSLLKYKNLSRPRIRAQVLPATSSISLHTLCNNSSDIGETKEKPSITSFDRWDNMYEFLTDGARAVRAFCRPRPMAVIGVPKDINFNISKAEFTLTVVVRPCDIPSEQQLIQAGKRSRSSSPLSSASSESLIMQEDADWATEIYVPVVHYAHPRLVAKSTGQTASSEDLIDSPIEEQRNRSFHSSSRTVGASGSSATLITTPSISDESAMLDISVEVTGGEWSVSEQVLKWWYPLPEGEETKEYTISIKRTGGAIKTQGGKDRTCVRLWSDICAAFNYCVT